MAFEIIVPQTAGNESRITVNPGQVLFVLGANGVGKSELLQLIYNRHSSTSKWILAHRTLWLQKNSAAISAHDLDSKLKMVTNDTKSTGRYQDSYFFDRRNISLVELTQAQILHDRHISKAWQDNNEAELKRLTILKSPIARINEIMAFANLGLVISLSDRDEFMVSKNGGAAYSIVKLSDGEKNTFNICADIITAKPDTLILLDEPERHLHRSIISPLLTSLIQQRPDCAFIIATHNIESPDDHPGAEIMLVRSVDYLPPQNLPTWEFNLVTDASLIPDSYKKVILGSRKKILFVEGNTSSLDRDLYQLLLSDVSVVSKNSCVAVERSVEGIRGNPTLNWVEAFGLIDADDRTVAQITDLERKGVFALTAYSVEYLYYGPDTIREAARHFSSFTGEAEDDVYNRAITNIITNLVRHRDRLCARLCEKRVREKINRFSPTHEQILAGGNVNVVVDFGMELAAEQKIFDDLVTASDIDSLMKRYPFRETPVIDGIVTAIGIRKEVYISAVRKMVLDGGPIKVVLKRKLGNLVNAINPVPTAGAAVPPAAAANPAP